MPKVDISPQLLVYLSNRSDVTGSPKRTHLRQHNKFFVPDIPSTTDVVTDESADESARDQPSSMGEIMEHTG